MEIDHHTRKTPAGEDTSPAAADDAGGIAMLSERATPSSLRRHASRTPMLEASDERACLVRIRDRDDPAAWRRILSAYARLVVAIAARYARARLSFADLVAEGNFGLVEAVRRFDLARGVRLSAYAPYWIHARVREFALHHRRPVPQPASRGARRLLARMSRIERALAQERGAAPSLEEVAAAARASVEDVERVRALYEARDVPITRAVEAAHDVLAELADPEVLVAAREEASCRSREVRAAIASLDARERRIVHDRHLSPEPRSLRAIGADLQLSRERVRQIQRGAEEKLRRLVRAARDAKE